MKLTYDPTVDAAYIYLADPHGGGRVAHTYACDPIEVNGMINLDFDTEGRLIGLEVLDASKKLPGELLRAGWRRGRLR